MAGYKHVVFDFDGTLANSELINLRVWRRLVKELSGRTCSLDELTFTIGRPLEDSVASLCCPDTAYAAVRWNQIRAEFVGEVLEFPQAAEMIVALREQGYSLGIVSSSARSLFTQLELGKRYLTMFDEVILADDTERHKPDPDPLLAYLDRVGAQAAETLYVGDAPGDLACARAAGVDFAFAAWGAHQPLEGADYTLTSPLDILGIV